MLTCPQRKASVRYEIKPHAGLFFASFTMPRINCTKISSSVSTTSDWGFNNLDKEPKNKAKGTRNVKSGVQIVKIKVSGGSGKKSRLPHEPSVPSKTEAITLLEEDAVSPKEEGTQVDVILERN